jgi:hypothetical protein
MPLYRDIVYLEDDASVDGLQILEHQGRQAAIDYLLRFDKNVGRVKKRLVAPGHQLRVGKFILYYDPYASHIGLLEIV